MDQNDGAENLQHPARTRGTEKAGGVISLRHSCGSGFFPCWPPTLHKFKKNLPTAAGGHATIILWQ